MGIWLLNKNRDVLRLTSVDNSISGGLSQLNGFESVSDGGEGVVSKFGGVCNLTARLRDSRNAIVSSSFVLDYENSGRLSLSNTSTANVSLILCSVDGHFRVYSCQDYPMFHNWSIIEQFTCNIFVGSYQSQMVVSFSMLKGFNVLEYDVYNTSTIAIGSNNGVICVFCRFNLVIEDFPITTDASGSVIGGGSDKRSHDFVSWDCLYDTRETKEDDTFVGVMKRRGDILDLKWCPNYSRSYEILASSHDSLVLVEDGGGRIEGTVSREMDGLPWIGIWRWDLYGKGKGILTLVYSLINQTNYPTNCISWDIKGTEFIACTEYNITRFVQCNNINTNDQLDDDLDDFISMDSLIFHTKLLGINNPYITDFPLYVKFIRPI